MARPQGTLQFDEIGYWSQIKLAILGEYAKPYNTILSSKRLHTVYIDAFAGAGHHLAKKTGEWIKGSPARALEVQPPFDFLHFVDMDQSRMLELQRLSTEHRNVLVHHGDANEVLPREVFPEVRWDQYRRGLCILDPYGLDLDWKLIAEAGRMRSIEIFLNFPVMDMNRNVLWRNPERMDALQIDRMNRFWGDNSWRSAAYSATGNLFAIPEKQTNDDVAEAFRQRIQKIAGFAHVPEPMPMRNSKGATVYYLYFASQDKTGLKIVEHIFDKYRNTGMV